MVSFCRAASQLTRCPRTEETVEGFPINRVGVAFEDNIDLRGLNAT
jgi:hypothetical protein